MKKLFFILAILTFFSCSHDDEQQRLISDITYLLTTLSGAIINKVEYLESQGDMIKFIDVTSLWGINLTVRAGLGLQVIAYGDIPYQGSPNIMTTWKPEGGTTDTEILRSGILNSLVNSGLFKVLGRVLPD